MRAGSAGGQGLPAFYFGEMKKRLDSAKLIIIFIMIMILK